MLLTYEYKGQSYKVFIHWTADTGCSSVFREIVRIISDRHQFEPDSYQELAEYLDALTDKLYEQIYIFTDEHSSVPYNPAFRRDVLRVLSEIGENIKACPLPVNLEHENPLAILFADVADKLRETVDVFLEDNTYHEKFRYRRRKLEQSVEATDESKFSCEFEDVLVQMTDLTQVMDCLTEIQRRRLVKHVFLKYTLKEIGIQEEVSEVMIHKSIAAALSKLQKRLS